MLGGGRRFAGPTRNRRSRDLVAPDEAVSSQSRLALAAAGAGGTNHASIASTMIYTMASRARLREAR